MLVVIIPEMCRKNQQSYNDKKFFFVLIASLCKKKKKEKRKKSMCTITHQQNTIGRKTPLHCIMQQQTIILRQLFTGHMVGFWP